MIKRSSGIAAGVFFIGAILITLTFQNCSKVAFEAEKNGISISSSSMENPTNTGLGNEGESNPEGTLPGGTTTPGTTTPGTTTPGTTTPGTTTPGTTTPGTATPLTPGGTGTTTRTLVFQGYNVVSSSAVFDYSAVFKIDVNQVDLASTKHAFLAAFVPDGRMFLYNFSANNWSEGSQNGNWTSSFLGQHAYSLSKVASSYPVPLYSVTDGDFTSLGGTKIYVGYGVGENARASMDEMLAFRDNGYSNGRFHLLYDIPKQQHSVVIDATGTTTTNLAATARIYVDHLVYSQQGYYFVAAKHPTNDEFFIFDGSNWTLFNPSSGASTGLKSFGAKSAITNKVISISAPYSNSDLAGFKLFAGYGIGADVATAFDDLLRNNRFNQEPYVIAANPSSVASSTNYSLGGTSSGALTNYSIAVNYKVADAHVGKVGYVFTFASFAGNFYVYKASTNSWLLWDGVLNTYGSAISLPTGSQSLTVLSQGDVTSLGGAKIYIGYGLGATPNSAVSDMLNSSRFREFASIAIQEFNGKITFINYSKTSSANATIRLEATPHFSDYGNPGQIFIALRIGEEVKFLNPNLSWTDSTAGLIPFSNQTSLKFYRYDLVYPGTTIAEFSGSQICVGSAKDADTMLTNNRFYCMVIP